MMHDCNHLEPHQMTTGPCPNCQCPEHHPEMMCVGCDELVCYLCWDEHNRNAPCHVDQEHEGTVADSAEAQPAPTAGPVVSPNGLCHSCGCTGAYTDPDDCNCACHGRIPERTWADEFQAMHDQLLRALVDLRNWTESVMNVLNVMQHDVDGLAEQDF